MCENKAADTPRGLLVSGAGAAYNNKGTDKRKARTAGAPMKKRIKKQIKNGESGKMNEFWEWAVDAVWDSVRMLPFLFAAYWLIEYVEQRHSEGVERILAGGGRFGFVPGAVLGLLPQCGFSAMAANLYASRVVSLGTLLAVFLATSDEAVPLMLASPGHWRQLAALLAVKLAVALLAGFLADIALRGFVPQSLRGGYLGSAREVDCHEHEEDEGILKAACRHTLHIFLFILAFNLALGALTAAVGEDNLGAFLAAAGPLQPLAAGLIGLVPNCVSSVLLTQLYLAGQLSLGGVVAGLCTGAGVGLAVLLRANKSKKQNCFIILLLYLTGTAAGLLCGLLG